MATLSATHDDQPTRRDMLAVAGTTFAGVGGALMLWPFIDQMNPDASALALSSIEVDLKPVKEGQAITVLWRGKPVFIRNRTKDEIAQARAVKMSDLLDPKNAQEPEVSADDTLRVKPGHDNWIVLVGVCTHLGCVPKGQAVGDVRGDYNGWFCPCHGSQYDVSGRVRKGPAPYNLDVPPYTFLTDTKIKIG